MSLIPQDRSKLSPMMQQYLSMKDEHRDQILMFRLGDFYEMFFDDAVTASRELELTLTGRDCGLPDRAPMCGVPYHSVENYIARLVKKGYKVAICEQMENPALAKGMVKRDIVPAKTLVGEPPQTRLWDILSQSNLSASPCAIAPVSFCAGRP